MTAESQVEALEGPEEVRLEPATPEENLKMVSDMDTLLLSKDGLERYDHVADRSISQTK